MEKKFKNPGLKSGSDSGMSSIPAIKGKPGLFGLSNFCQTLCFRFYSGISSLTMVDNWNA